MTAISRVESMRVEVSAGARIEDAIARSIDLAKSNRCHVTFEFNGVSLTVRSGSDETAVLRWWGEIMSAKAKALGAVVGPMGIEWGTDGR